MTEPKDVIEEALDVVEEYESKGVIEVYKSKDDTKANGSLTIWLPYIIPVLLIPIAIILDITDHDSLARWMYWNVVLGLLGVKFGIIGFPNRKP